MSNGGENGNEADGCGPNDLFRGESLKEDDRVESGV